MNIKQFTSIYYSPTGSTARVAGLIADQIGGNRENLDLTNAGRRPDYHFTENEAVLVGVPVYGGRIPATAAERLKKLHGRQTLAVLVVTYGNRAYEDALLELKDILTAQGFRPMAAAAVVTQHNIVNSIAEGRPDKRDQKRLQQFGAAIHKHLGKLSSNYSVKELAVPGNRPYRKYQGVPLKIKVGSGCNGCGLCIRRCPEQAISRTDPKVMDEARCSVCMRCVKECPKGARKINPLMLMAAGQALKKACAGRKEIEFFV